MSVLRRIARTISGPRSDSLPLRSARPIGPNADFDFDVLDKIIFGSRLHESTDPARRVEGVQALPPDSKVLVQMLGDPAPEVRSAAGARCSDATALAAALRSESEQAVRVAHAASLGKLLAVSADDTLVHALLAAPEFTDAARAQIVLHTADEARRHAAIVAIGDEDALVDIAIGAEHASVRAAAAERVHTPEPLRRLLKGVRDKDRGVARLARERLDSIEGRARNAVAADRILQEAEALVDQPGHILTAAVEIDRRWKALALSDDAARRARWEDIGRRIQQRFDRELDEQRAHAQFEHRLDAWLDALQDEQAVTALPALREQWNTLRAEAASSEDKPALARLEQAGRQIAQWEQAAPALAAAEALVLEAEQLASGTPIDDAQLPARWQAIELAARTPALTRRFEAALLVIDQRRLAVIRASQQEQTAARHELHTVLHEAEQALAAGHLQEARAATDRTRALKLLAGQLPKPTVQRLSRVVQQLVELERWQQFGQQTARVQLCERAEALLQRALRPASLAREVQQLRGEWKKLDEAVEEKRGSVPKALWDRFDGACERAYAPAARHFAEQTALHNQARKQRDEFIAAAAAHAATLVGETPDWRAIERWLRETESAWRDKALGSVEPVAWKKLDARLREAVAPARDALQAAGAQARQARESLIAEADALGAKAAERDTPTRVKELQARWQANAKSFVLPQRDERALWEKFRGACSAVFEARTGSRKAEEDRRRTQRRAFEALAGELEKLAQSTDADDATLRSARHDLQEQWKMAVAEHGPAPAALEARFRSARVQADQAKKGQARAAEAAALQTLLAKERLCEEADALAAAEGAPEPAVVESLRERWAALPPLPAEWELKLGARRDAALEVHGDEDARYDHAERVKESVAVRRDALLELELTLGMESPRDLQPQRLAVQVKILRDRFKRTTGGDSALQILLNWCALPGSADARDQQRAGKIVASLQRRR